MDVGTSLRRSFGRDHFGAAQLGGARRTRRLVKSADAILRHPGGTLPQRGRGGSSRRCWFGRWQRKRRKPGGRSCPYETLQSAIRNPEYEDPHPTLSQSIGRGGNATPSPGVCMRPAAATSSRGRLAG
jgi:hypothetical protein